ncbi:CAP domain-containing protein [bacterium]|nr:CAP domain-containing protein [bacterium]
MKKKLRSISMPALQELRKLLMPSAKETLATAPDQLKSRRKIVHLLANFRDAIVDAIVIPDQVESLVAVLEFEKQTVSALSDLPQDGLRTIKKNDEIARKSQIPIKEREGIREVNEWRLLLGLNALDLDPKLCEASRGHSEDMNKHKFFAHESPIAGKETPWKRAAKVGTKATGENIYMGSQTPASANKGWFFSPGHHKNMFKNTHMRIGLGQYERYWTQMFG